MKIFDTNSILNFDIRKSVALFGDRVYSVLNYQDPFKRSNKIGHFTASGLVIRDDKVLLILHPYLGRWFQPGGHIDDGESPIDAAIREVYEETGFVCVLDPRNLEPIDVDIHEIPSNSKKGEAAHLHIDLLYRLKVLREERSSENISTAWLSFDQVESARIQRVLAKLSP